LRPHAKVPAERESGGVWEGHETERELANDKESERAREKESKRQRWRKKEGACEVD